MSTLTALPASARPREKLLAQGPGALSDVELLAILLRTGLPGKDVLSLAAELLSTAPLGQRGGGGLAARVEGGLSRLLQASADDLKAIKGLGPAKRCEVLAVLELARRASLEQLRQQPVLDQPGTVIQHLQLTLAHRPYEVFAVLFLDAQNHLIALEELFRGTLTQTSVYPREVAVRALSLQARAVVLAHNHPSGDVEPSQADLLLTQTLKAALGLLDVHVLDHVIVGPGRATSLAQRGAI